MGEYAPRTIEEQEYYKILDTLRAGFTDPDGVEHRPNKGAAMALLLEANTGLRIVDILKLTPADISKHNLSHQLKDYINNYCSEKRIEKNHRIVPMCERNVQKLLKACCESLGLNCVSTHSFRRYGAYNVLLDNDNDVLAAQQFLKHDNLQTTLIYLEK